MHRLRLPALVAAFVSGNATAANVLVSGNSLGGFDPT
jgi:hypothetical protein